MQMMDNHNGALTSDDSQMVRDEPFPKSVPKITESVLLRDKSHYTAWVEKFRRYVSDEQADINKVTERKAGFSMINSWMVSVAKSSKFDDCRKPYIAVHVRMKIFEFLDGAILPRRQKNIYQLYEEKVRGDQHTVVNYYLGLLEDCARRGRNCLVLNTHSDENVKNQPKVESDADVSLGTILQLLETHGFPNSCVGEYANIGGDNLSYEVYHVYLHYKFHP